MDSDPGRAQHLLGRAAAILEAASPTRLPELRLARGRAALRANDEDAAVGDLRAGVDYFDRQRDAIPDESLRTAFFSTAAELYGELIAIELRRGRPESAFVYSDRARGRSLLDVDGRSRGRLKPLDAGGVAAALASLADDVAFVEYSFTGTGAIAWVATRQHLSRVDLTIDRPRLQRTIRDLRDAPAAPTAPAKLSDLYAWLVAPIRGRLTGKTALVVSPDGPLHLVPFAALRATAAGRSLIEDYAIALAPSLAWYLDARARMASRTWLPPSSLFAIGNPTIDRRDLPDLRDLPGAADEARTIAGHYGHSVLALGRDATPSRLRQWGPGADVIHFGGHAVVNVDAPEQSFLAMAPEAGSDGRLRAGEIARLSLEHTRLVVLGACSTASGPHLFGEGVLSLARPFLLAGVPSVVATLWDVDDRSTAKLLDQFHRRLGDGVDVRVALQRTQLAFLRSSDPAERSWYVWAPFVAISAARPERDQQQDP
jgi:CHAT domain-containing protein